MQDVLTQAITQQAHASWQPLLHEAIKTLPHDYRVFLTRENWLPGKDNIFNAFSQPKDSVRFVLYGESPDPRAASANGFAFWDAAVKEIWSEKSLSKTVNRATSLRNMLKMLQLAETGEKNFANASGAAAQQWVMQLSELFQNFLQHGFLLLNFNLSLSSMAKNSEAKAWRGFHECLLEALSKENKKVQLILFGKIAEHVLTLPAAKNFQNLIAPHPYNLSFIENQEVLKFFQPLHLLRA